MRVFICVSLFILSVGCDQLSSSFNNPEPEKPVVQEKPRSCGLNFAKTCWTDTVEAMTSCMSRNKGLDQFSPDRDHCRNKSGKFIEFGNAEELFTQPFDIFNSYFLVSYAPAVEEDDCLTIEGTGRDLQIQVAGYSQPVEVQWAEREFRFTCLDGQTISVPRQAAEDCGVVNGKGSIPGVELSQFSSEDGKSGWEMYFHGAQDSVEVFRCHL